MLAQKCRVDLGLLGFMEPGAIPRRPASSAPGSAKDGEILQPGKKGPGMGTLPTVDLGIDKGAKSTAVHCLPAEQETHPTLGATGEGLSVSTESELCKLSLETHASCALLISNKPIKTPCTVSKVEVPGRGSPCPLGRASARPPRSRRRHPELFSLRKGNTRGLDPF